MSADSQAPSRATRNRRSSAAARAVVSGCISGSALRLAYPEVCAALAAAGRAHRLERSDQSRAEAAWENYWAATRTVELTGLITTHAGRLAGEPALRGADAVHLASLLAVGVSQTLFAVWDQPLRAAAHAAGVQLAPVAQPAE